MKKQLARWILLLLVLSLTIVPIHAAEEDDGLTFGGDYRYQTDGSMTQVPHTLSVWIRVPKNLNYTVAVYGNYTLNADGYVNFEIQSSGAPKLSYVGQDGEEHAAIFNQVDVRTGEWLHLAIVHDGRGGNAFCYINGELRQTISGVTSFNSKALTFPFLLGGDFRPADYRYFRGEIGQTSVYSTARTAEQILADYQGADPTDPELIAYYDVDASSAGKDIEDLSGKGNHLTCIKVWLTEEEQRDIADFAYTFAVIGDTQSLLYNYPSDFREIYDWILDNHESEKIEYVFGLGDITDKDTTDEWMTAKKHLFRLNGVVAHSHARGNHDGVANYNNYMNNADYLAQFNGFYAEGDLTNTWRTFDVGSDHYLMLMLDMNPSTAVLDWACDIVEAHPDRKVIITTHSYLGSTNQVSTTSIWNRLASRYENIFLVMNGHFGKNENIVWSQNTGVHGNTVTQILIDPQEIDKYGEVPVGLVALLHFYEDGSRIEVEYYSTLQNAYYKPENQFTIWLTEPSVEDPEEGTDEEGSSDEEESSSTVESGTDAPVTDAGNSSATDDSGSKGFLSGCGAVVAPGSVSLVLLLGAAFVASKKRS